MTSKLAGGDRRLLFRSYFFVVAGLATVAIVLDFGFGYLQSSELRPDERWLATTFHLVERELAAVAMADRTSTASRLGDELGFGIQLLDSDDVISESDSQLDLLTVVDANGNISYLSAAKSINTIIRIGPITEPKQSIILRLLPPIFYISIFVVVSLWLRPLLSDMNLISRAAHRFAADYREPLNTKNSVSQLEGLAGNLDEMSARLSGLIQNQKELIAALSHEMRTPLARIRFAIAVIGDNADADLRKQLDALGNDVHEIDQLIATLLNYARLDHPDLRMNWQDVPISNWATPVIEKCRVPSKQIAFTANGDCESAWMDPRLMELALSNLLVNACRYANGQVRCAVTSRNNAYCMTVEDDGPGIPEPKRAGLFKAFARLDDSRSRQTGGYGLGLAIVARIAALHGGKVNVHKSGTLGGAKFELTWHFLPDQ